MIFYNNFLDNWVFFSFYRYINQDKNVVLTSAPEGDTDPSLKSHSEYRHYANFCHRGNLPNPITDLEVPEIDNGVYKDYLDIPKKYAILRAVGSNQYAAKSRYQAYEGWLKTGKLVVNNVNSKHKSSEKGIRKI